MAAQASKLDALSPLKVLGRGYAIGYTEEGRALDSVQGIQAGDRLRLRLADGTLHCHVIDVQEEK